MRGDASVTLESLIRNRIADLGYERVAQAIGHDASYVSRIVGGQIGIKLSELSALLEVMDIAALDARDSSVMTPVHNDDLKALKRLAQMGITTIGS